MNNVKSIFASKGVWTAAIGVVVAVLIALNKIPAGTDPNVVYGGVTGIIAALGGIFRFVADSKLVVNPKV